MVHAQGGRCAQVRTLTFAECRLEARRFAYLESSSSTVPVNSNTSSKKCSSTGNVRPDTLTTGQHAPPKYPRNRSILKDALMTITRSGIAVDLSPPCARIGGQTEDYTQSAKRG